MTPTEASVVLPMWRGRRGVINTTIAAILGIAAAAAFWWFAVATAVKPGCTAYGASRGLRYIDYEVFSRGIKSSSACVFATRNGGSEDVYLTDATSFLTDVWVGVAFALQITVPGFIVLFALIMTRLRRGGRVDPVDR